MVFNSAGPALAQSGGDVTRILGAVGVLALVVLVGGVVAVVVRRRMLGAAAAGAGDGALALSTIRDMHRRGEISDEEFVRLRAAALAAHGVAVADLPPGGGSEAGDERRAAPGVDLTGEPLPGQDPDARGGEKNPPGAS